MIDESYFVVGSHLDMQTIEQIQKGEYIDVGKLIPKDCIMVEEEQCMELVIHNGHTYYVPVCETTSISNFQRWEQAFRVFANIYMKTNANRSSELIEYNQIIPTASLNFVWENVYMYDKDFRLHMARNPQRNWGIILQQAWSLRLHDHINSANFQQNYNSSNNQLPSENRERIN